MIRPATVRDIPACVRLWEEMWSYHRALDPRYEVTPMALKVMGAWIGDRIQDPRSIVLVAGDPPAGYVLGMILENPPIVPWQFYGHISEMAVTAAQRRRGTGAKLLAAAHAWFKSQGCAYVEAQVSVRNPISRAFWRKHGYTDFIERLRIEL